MSDQPFFFFNIWLVYFKFVATVNPHIEKNKILRTAWFQPSFEANTQIVLFGSQFEFHVVFEENSHLHEPLISLRTI